VLDEVSIPLSGSAWFSPALFLGWSKE